MKKTRGLDAGRRRRGLALAACSVVALAGLASAKDLRGMFTVKGVGVLDCAAYLAAAEAGGDELGQFAGYITGYASAYNEHVDSTYDLLPWQNIDTVMIVVARRCENDPTRNFGLAVSEVATFFRELRLKELAGREVAGEGDAAVEMYGPVLRQVKDALLRNGYLADTDGDFTAAVRAAQSDFGLEATGVPDQLTLLRLLYRRGDDEG